MILVITGPTASGKTHLSLELAKTFNAEIISADSRQIYKELNIGVDKVNDTKGIKHHMIDITSVTEFYTVKDYQEDARCILDKLIAENKNVIIVGGTGLYIKALLYDYCFKDDSNINLSEYSREYLESLIDPEKVDINNLRRVKRYLINKLNNNEDDNPAKLYDFLAIGLIDSRENLYNKINARVDSMIEEGLIEEARLLYDKYQTLNLKALDTIGYKELFSYFDGDISLDEAIELIKKNSRHYAKRQITYFKHQLDLEWFNSNDLDAIEEFIINNTCKN